MKIRHSMISGKKVKKKHFERFIAKSLRPVPSQGMVEHAKKTWWLQNPTRSPRIRMKTPESKVAEDGT